MIVLGTGGNLSQPRYSILHINAKIIANLGETVKKNSAFAPVFVGVNCVQIVAYGGEQNPACH